MFNNSVFADIILISDSIFTAEKGAEAPFSGMVAIKGNRIAAVGDKSHVTECTGAHTKIYDLGDRLICPGFVDNHEFFTGYAWSRIGLNASEASDKNEAAELIKKYAEAHPEGTIAGHGLNIDTWPESDKGSGILNEICSDRPIAIFTTDRSFCWMNDAAYNKYGIPKDGCYAEICWRFFNEILNEKEYIAKEYESFNRLLASRGVTSIKEIGFDDYSGFTEMLIDMDGNRKLYHRVNLVSQPVAREIDFMYAEKQRTEFRSSFLKFMGFNIMVDGEISAFEGDMLEPYSNRRYTCNITQVDYTALEKAVLEADRRGFRCALHAEGDAAVRKTIDIFEKCRKVNGPRDLRHAIIDLEIVQPDDILRMSSLNISAINYVQIMNCTEKYSEFYAPAFVGKERLENYWPYRSMIDSGVNVCCGTDLPLDIPDIPLSIYFAAGRKFPDGRPEEGFNKKQAMTVADIIRAWTINGQYANFEENRLGTIEAGKIADIAVLNRNVFNMPMDEVKNAEVCLTISDGRVVYQKDI